MASSILPTIVPSVYSRYVSHSSGIRIHTDTVIQDALQSQNSKYHVTATNCDLIKYAKAGNATAQLSSRVSPHLFYRDYQATIGQIGQIDSDQPTNGTLKTTDIFAGYTYVWQGHSLIVLVINCQNDLSIGPAKHRSYILFAKSEDNETENDTCSIADSLIQAAGSWDDRSDEEIWVFDRGRCIKDRALWLTLQNVTFNDVVLPNGMKEDIMRDTIGFFDARKHYQNLGTPWKRGIIFHGHPGNGKTTTIKSIMNTLMHRSNPIPTLYVKTLAVQSFGPQWSLQIIFTKARQIAPCLLIFEDIDSAVTDSVRSYFFNELDGLESNEGILILGSTNDLEKLDVGLSKRPSRFDRKYRFDLPEYEERLRYCKLWSLKFSGNPAVDLQDFTPEDIAKETEGFGFAYIKEAYIGSLLSILSVTEKQSGDLDLSQSDQDAKPRPFSDIMKEQISSLRSEMAQGDNVERREAGEVGEAKS